MSSCQNAEYMHINSTLLKLQVIEAFQHSKIDVIIVWLIESSNVTEKRLKQPYIVLEPTTTGAYIDIWTRRISSSL